MLVPLFNFRRLPGAYGLYRGRIIYAHGDAISPGPHERGPDRRPQGARGAGADPAAPGGPGRSAVLQEPQRRQGGGQRLERPGEGGAGPGSAVRRIDQGVAQRASFPTPSGGGQEGRLRGHRHGRARSHGPADPQVLSAGRRTLRDGRRGHRGIRRKAEHLLPPPDGDARQQVRHTPSAKAPLHHAQAGQGKGEGPQGGVRHRNVPVGAFGWRYVHGLRGQRAGDRQRPAFHRTEGGSEGPAHQVRPAGAGGRRLRAGRTPDV
ncbi:MAG: hypothetical protein A4E30_00560 [Methanomassiliicoccales archaeon PtaB.Bin215]|nr:MAG: hypothetical protein A4E30_00560 [Methanomassiliicoccales archaeon PtaB.Bin215]